MPRSVLRSARTRAPSKCGRLSGMNRNLGRFHRSKGITLLKHRSIVCRANDCAMAASVGLAIDGRERLFAKLAPDVVIAELPRLSEGHDDVQLDQIDQLVI